MGDPTATPALTALHLSSCINIKLAAAAAAALAGRRQLTFLSLKGCYKIKRAESLKLQGQMPWLQLEADH